MLPSRWIQGGHLGAGLLLLGLLGCGTSPSAPADDPAESELTATVLFEMRVDGVKDLWEVRLDGSDLRRITSHPSDDRWPTSVREEAVFTSYRGGSADLYRITGAEETAESITSTPWNTSQAALSPDGSGLAFIRDDSGVPKLWVSEPDGAGAARVTEGFGFTGSIETSPTWAPDGNRIAFVSAAGGSADLHIVDVETGTVSPLLTDDAALVEPAWSPDGTRIVFASDMAGESTDLWMISVPATGEAEGPIRLTERGKTDGRPAWLPDGRIVYTAWLEDGETELRWLEPDDSDPPRRILIQEGSPSNPAGW